MGNNQFEEDRLIFVNQMEIFVSQKMFAEALIMAEERLSRFPSDADARASINLTLIELGRFEESRNVLHELEKDIIRLSFGYLRAADTYRDKGLMQDAVFCYQKFLSLNPHAENSREVSEKIAQLQREECLASEVPESDSTSMAKPEFYTMTLAELYIQQGHPKMAADILAEIMKREPANVQARVKLDSVEAALALKSSSGDDVALTNNLINILSCWLDNIGRLKNHAT
jgi:tetratricopeptide (TPR) repeat protein